MNWIKLVDRQIEETRKYFQVPERIVMTPQFYIELCKECEQNPGILDNFRPAGDAVYRGIPISLVTEVGLTHPFQVAGPVMDTMKVFNFVDDEGGEKA